MSPLECYNSREEYLDALHERSFLPVGFKCATVPLVFVPEEKPDSAPLSMNLSLIVLEEATPLFGAVFTKNAFPGFPIIIGRRRLSTPRLKGILINNRIANVGAARGDLAAESLLKSLGKIMHCPATEFIPSSTGIIGWRLPLAEMRNALDPLVLGLSVGSVLPVAEAIMTTDSFPKVRDAYVGQGRLVAVAKGAGMIEPDMATLLVFILTDLAIDRTFLRNSLKDCVERTFNRISVDGDQSTSDTVLLLSSGKKPVVSEEEFSKALEGVCRKLAEDVVRNGEGTAHVISVTVEAPFEERIVLAAARAVINSPLVKTAVFGNDPNVGRLLSALGDFLGSMKIPVNQEELTISMGGVEIFSRGSFHSNREREVQLSAYLAECSFDSTKSGYPVHDRKVDIRYSFAGGGKRVTVLGSDLSYDYVRINADYRS